jgi:hypothetical protein
VALLLAGGLEGAVGTAIAQAAAPRPDVIVLLQQEPQAELQMLFDALQPVEQQTLI